jgi:hypothetical protein
VLDGNGNPLILPILYVANDDILYVGSAPGLTPDEVDQLTWDQDFVLTNPDGATRDMDQYQLLVDGRGDWWNFSGSLVYTELTGNFFSVSGYQQAAGIGAGAYVYPNEQTNYLGRLQNANEWEAKLRFDATLPWTLRAGAYLRFFSGEFYAPIYEIDGRAHDFYAADGSYFDPDLIFYIDGQDVFLEPRGNREYDSSTLLDLHLDKGIPLGGSSELVIGFDLFNALGADTVTEVEDLVNTGSFGAVTEREDPRTWRLFAAFRF